MKGVTSKNLRSRPPLILARRISDRISERHLQRVQGIPQKLALPTQKSHNG